MRDCKGIQILLGMSLLPEKRGPPTLTGGLQESEPEPHELSAEFFFSLSWSPTRWASCQLPCFGFSSSSTTGAFTELGSCCAWPPPCGGHTEVVSARLNLSNGTIDVRRVYVPRFFVSAQQRFGATDIKALDLSQLSGLGQTVL